MDLTTRAGCLESRAQGDVGPGSRRVDDRVTNRGKSPGGRGNRDRMGEGRPVLHAIPAIPHAYVWFDLRAREAARLPRYLGSTLRGGLARALRRTACVAHRVRDCRVCPFLNACSYAYLFETPRPPWAERYPTMTTVPHPLVLEPPLESGPLEAGAGVGFGVRLFGRAIRAFPFLVVAVRRMAEAGLGASRARFEMVRAVDGGPGGKVLYEGDDLAPLAEPTMVEGVPGDRDGATRLALRFETPTRLVEDGRLLRKPGIEALVRSLAFRAATLAYFHAGLDWDPTPLDQAASENSVREVASDIVWTPLSRFSTRQDRKVPLEGFVGRVAYEGDALRTLWPLLRLGEILHVGKGTVFGLGRYRLVNDAGKEA